MSAQTVSAGLSQLSDAVRLTFQLIGRLSKLSFQPGSTPLHGDGDVRVELSNDIGDHLKQHDETLEALRQEAEDLVGVGTQGPRRRNSVKDRERLRTEAQLARLAEDLRHARSQFRAAQLAAKRASETAKQKERELLFRALQQPPRSDSPSATPDPLAVRRPQQARQQLTQDELLVNASSDVTSALRRTHDLLTSELSRSRFAQDTLEQSTAALSDLGERYTDLDSLLSNSKTLLGTLLRSQKSDTWYLETAFYILVTTLCWLVFRRLIYGPAWWFLWLPLKYLIFRPFYFIFAAFGIKTAPSPAAGVSVSSLESTTSRPPLRIQPSAKAGVPSFPAGAGMEFRQKQAIPAGGGGAGAKIGMNGERRDPSPPGSLSQQIGQMAEASREQQGQKEASKDLPRRGDGTVLQERGDTPRNPKKRMMMDEDVESDKHRPVKRDEL